jgi:hypothetical protein
MFIFQLLGWCQETAETHDFFENLANAVIYSIVDEVHYNFEQ